MHTFTTQFLSRTNAQRLPMLSKQLLVVDLGMVVSTIRKPLSATIKIKI